MGYFVYNGIRSEDMGLVVQYYPAQPKPQRRVTKIAVPGRNGVLRIPEDSWENVTCTYNCYLRGGPVQASAVAEWLYSSSGYAELRDSYHEGGFRLAAFDGPADIENILNRRGRITISFDCRPEFWLDSGKEKQVFTPTARTFTAPLYNPTSHPAKPLIRIYTDNGQVAVTFYREGHIETSMTITGIEGYIDLDCGAMLAYKGSTNMAAKISTAEGVPVYPEIAPGSGGITFAAPKGVTPAAAKIEITPRWWTL